LTVPIADAAGGWRAGLGWWALPALLAAIPWLPTVRGDRPLPVAAREHVRLLALARSRIAWAIALFFGLQSIQAYIAFGWFSRFFISHGIAPSTAGAMVALLTAVGIPISLAAPRVPPGRQRLLVVCLFCFSLAAYIGLALAPVGGAWLWMVLAGIGGGTFPVSLTLIGLRARTAATAASLSAFAQGIGYVIAGIGPLLFGALFGLTGSWGVPLAVLFVALGLNVFAAWPATADRRIEDELGASLR
jgi:CP family cyanate transporter-like MFS transporter